MKSVSTGNRSSALLTGGRFSFLKAAYIFPLAIIFLFFIIPVLAIFRNIYPVDFAAVLQNPYYRSIIGFTFLQAAVSTLSAVLTGLPGAWIMSHIDFKGKRFVNSLTTVPFVLPSVLVVLGFVLCFGNSGILNTFLMKITGGEKPPLKILYSFKAIILAHTFYNFPIALRLISSAWKKIGRNRIEAAGILGAGKTKIFLTITLPSLLPSIIAAASLIFIFCFMSFAIILVLGGGPAYTTLEVEIYRLARLSVDIEAAASLALAGALLTSAFTYLYIRLQKRVSFHEIQEQPVPLKKPGSISFRGRVILMLYLVLIILLILGPLAAVAFRSFQSREGWSGELVFSVKSYSEIMTGSFLKKAVVNSIIYAFGTLLIAMPAGLIAAYVIARRRIKFTGAAETMFMLPMGVSAVVIGLGYYSILALLPDNFGRNGLFIVFAHSVIALPFVVRTLSTGIRAVGISMIEASQTLGAGFMRTLFRIELPLLKGSLISAAAFAFCISTGEINATLILSEGGSATIPIAIYRLISSYNFFGACAMGTILMIICGTAFYLIDRHGGGEIF